MQCEAIFPIAGNSPIGGCEAGVFQLIPQTFQKVGTKRMDLRVQTLYLQERSPPGIVISGIVAA